MPKRGNTNRVYLDNAIKTLATNIRFASVDDPVVTLAITSSVPDEGKSTIAVALAKAMAGGGRDVLLVECDMRRRSLANMLGLHAKSGLYAVISEQVSLDEAVVATSTSGLWFLDCEPHIPNPVDVLSSRRFQAFVRSVRKAYDFVIFDTPPLSAFVDAAALSAELDAALLVVRENFVRRDELTAAYDQLKKAEANVIGVVMNYCEREKGDYYSYYVKDEKHRHKKAEGSSSQESPAPDAAGCQTRQQPRSSDGSDKPRRAAAATAAPANVPQLKPLPKRQPISPDSTAQFLVGVGYRPRVPMDDE